LTKSHFSAIIKVLFRITLFYYGSLQKTLLGGLNYQKFTKEKMEVGEMAIIGPGLENIAVEAERLPFTAKREKIKRKGLAWHLNAHARRIGVIIFSLLIGRNWFYLIIGIINRCFADRPINHVFLLYPANQKYTEAYSYKWYARLYKWTPGLAGFYMQSGKIGLTFAFSAVEADFIDKNNSQKLIRVYDRMERLRKLIGARQKSFAGILPGILWSRKIASEFVERRSTAKAIEIAIEKVRAAENLPVNVTVVILGGSGFIGSFLSDKNKEFIPVDLGNKEHLINNPKLKNRPVIILNLTKKSALNYYAPFLWPGAVIINEVYPEPSPDEVRMLAERRVAIYHIVGIEGKALPAFPRGYEGGIPCCASHIPSNRNYNVIIKKM
jgi:hypothetical protein